jgi:hypothetical protein
MLWLRVILIHGRLLVIDFAVVDLAAIFVLIYRLAIVPVLLRITTILLPIPARRRQRFFIRALILPFLLPVSRLPIPQSPVLRHSDGPLRHDHRPFLHDNRSFGHDDAMRHDDRSFLARLFERLLTVLKPFFVTLALLLAPVLKFLLIIFPTVLPILVRPRRRQARGHKQQTYDNQSDRDVR